jgi:hypothetical protein
MGSRQSICRHLLVLALAGMTTHQVIMQNAQRSASLLFELVDGHLSHAPYFWSKDQSRVTRAMEGICAVINNTPIFTQADFIKHPDAKRSALLNQRPLIDLPFDASTTYRCVC